MATALIAAGLPAPRAVAAGAHPPLPDPLAISRFLAEQRAGFGDPVRAAELAGRAEQRAAAIDHAPRTVQAFAGQSVAAWQPLGPSPVAGSYYGGASSGRVDALAVVPSGPSAGEIFAGTAGGGVWSSTDGGAHWTTHTDQVASGLAIGALAIDPSDPSTIYAGTGEDNDCGDCFYGGGVLKSTDGGQTWTVENPGGIFSGVDFASLAVDPNHPSDIYGATSAGLFESRDGGVTWSHPSGTGDFTDPASTVLVTPSSDAVYVATSGDGVQESTDGGADFTLLSGLPQGAEFGVTALGAGADTSTYPNGEQTLYAAVALNGATDPSNGGGLSLYASSDGGQTWTRVTSEPAYTNQAYAFGAGTADQASFDNTIAVDPANPAHVIVGGISALESTDGGTTWQDLNGQDFFGPAANVLHPDFHAIAFAPSGHVVLGTDGGVFGYDPGHPGPAGITNLNTDLDTTMAYEDLGVSTDGSAVLAGLQDNGTALYGGSSAWDQILSGNGGANLVNPLDAQEQLAEGDGSLELTTDGWTGAGLDITPPGEPSTRANFVPPLALIPNPSNPDSPTVLYGGADLWLTSNPTAATPTWAQLTTVGTGVSAIAVAPSDPEVVYVGFDDGTIEVTTDASAPTPTFTAISPGIAQWVTHIAVSPTDPGQLAVTFSSSNSRTSSMPPMVDTAAVALSGTPSAVYTDVTGNLPTGVASSSVVFDNGSLAIATDVGVFATPLESLNGASTAWSALGTGLPNVQVLGLTLDSAGDLFAATHGRGIWKLPAPSASTPPALTLVQAPGISGSPVVGDVLTALAAGWSGTPTSIIYAWLRCNGSLCTAITGATGTTYTLTTADVGATIRLDETAAAGGPQTSALSAALGPVSAPAGAGGGSSSSGGGGSTGSSGGGTSSSGGTTTGSGGAGAKPGGGTSGSGGTSPPTTKTVEAKAHTALATLLAHAAPASRKALTRPWSIPFAAPSAGRLTVRIVLRVGSHQVVLAGLAAKSPAAGRRLSVRVRLSAAARALLRRRGVLHVIVQATFVPAHTAAIKLSRTVVVRH